MHLYDQKTFQKVVDGLQTAPKRQQDFRAVDGALMALAGKGRGYDLPRADRVATSALLGGADAHLGVFRRVRDTVVGTLEVASFKAVGLVADVASALGSHLPRNKLL